MVYFLPTFGVLKLDVLKLDGACSECNCSCMDHTMITIGYILSLLNINQVLHMEFIASIISYTMCYPVTPGPKGCAL